MFKPASLAEFPALKAKAAVSRALVKPMLAVVKGLFPADSQIVHAYRLINEFIMKCQKVDIVPSPLRARVLSETMATFLTTYLAMANSEAKDGFRTFHMTIKFHHADHMGDRVRFETPTFTTEYAFEDIAGRVARVSSSCTRSLSADRIAKKCLTKLRIVSRIAVQRWRQRTGASSSGGSR